MVFGENTLNFKLKSTCLLSGELRNLPQWSFVDLNDGATKQCRLATRRYRGLTLSFNPVSVCCVMWATSRYRGLSSSSVSVCCVMWATRRYRGLSSSSVSVCCVMWATRRYRGLSSSSVSVCCAMWATRRYRGLSSSSVSVCCVMWATRRYRGLSSSSVSVCCAMWALSSAQNVLYTCWCVNVVQTYNLLSEKWFTHASPTLFNSGTCRPQMSRYFVDSVAVDLKHVYYIHCILIVVGR